MKFWTRSSQTEQSSKSSVQAGRSADGSGRQTIDTSALSDERLVKTKDEMRRVASSFGEIVALLMRFDRYKVMPLGELEWRVVPAIIHRQFSLAEAQSKSHGGIRPIGLVLWAEVSDEVDRQLSQDSGDAARLSPRDWTSGDHLWVVDAIGDPTLLQSMMKHLNDNQWSGRVAKIRLRNADGSLKIAHIGGAQAA